MIVFFEVVLNSWSPIIRTSLPLLTISRTI
jgi:hypothetical protein